MVEVNPRPRKPNLFVQVFVAVISGAAAMYCIQSLHPAVEPPAPAARKNSPAPRGVEAQPPRPAAPPAAEAPAAGDEPVRFKAAPPAAVSMLIAPEPGGASGGIVSVGDDQPPPDAAVPAPAKDETPAAPPERNETPVVHLQHSGFPGGYAPVGHDFQSPQLSPHAFPKKIVPKVESARPAPAANPTPHFIVYPRSLDDKGIAQKDVFIPSVLHPEIVEEKPFWDSERERRALIAGLIALSGVLYLTFAMGFFNGLFAKPRGDS